MQRAFILAAFSLLLGGALKQVRAADFNFGESYQSVSLTGELVGLNLDANGNGSNVDPAEVLLFTVPPNVGITASPSQPYVFVPHTFEQAHEDPFTHVVSVNTSTTPGVYGFNVRNGQILTAPLDLTMVDSFSKVNLFFNAGSFVTAGGSAAEYGITADGESDYYWPTVDSFVSYTPVPEPTSIASLLVGAGILTLRRRRRGA